MIKSTVQLGQMSAAQRLDEVFGLPEGSEVYVLNDPETKVPIAIMDGTLISAIRTGAVTGVCAKYMAPSRSKTVGLFGAGPQCKTQLMALKASLPQLEKAYVYDLSRERAEKFAAEMSQKLNMDVQAASDRLATIESGDILVTATTATEPIIHGAEIKKGVYVAHLGNNEVDEELILRADKVVIDDWETDKHRMDDTMAYMFRDGKIDDSRHRRERLRPGGGAEVRPRQRRPAHLHLQRRPRPLRRGDRRARLPVCQGKRHRPEAQALGRAHHGVIDPNLIGTTSLYQPFGQVRFLAGLSTFFRGRAAGEMHLQREFCLYRGRFREYNGCR